MTKQMQIYEVSLEPMDSFFFGGEIVFGGEGSDERRSSYLVHSRYLPQQTSLLGMLREQLLRNNGLLLSKNSSAADRQQAATLVGNTGFSAGHQNSFGVIQGLSALTLRSADKRIWQPAPLDDALGKDDRPLRWKALGEEWLLEHYDPKQGLSLQFETSGSTRKTLAECFSAVENVGITVTNRQNWRPNRGGEEAFFYKTSYRPKRSAYRESIVEHPESAFHFVFRVALDASLFNGMKPLQSGTVVLGGERSTFKLNINAVSGDLNDHLTTPEYCYNTDFPADYQRVILLSDTYLPASKLSDLGVFTVANTIPFRFFSSYLDRTQNFNQVDRKAKTTAPSGGGRRQSKRFTFLQRGGVLLVSKANLAQLTQLIDQPAEFRHIGYNQYAII